MNSISTMPASTDAAELESYLTSTAAEPLVADLAATSDEDLTSLLRRADARELLIDTILGRFPELAVAEQVQQMTGVVGLELTLDGDLVEDRTLDFDGKSVQEIDDAQEWDVILSTSVLHFLRVVTGQQNAALLAIAGDLTMEGNAELAIDLAGVFSVTGEPGVAVDPTALDPVEVAAAVKRSTPDNLRAVMSSSVRPMVLSEIFRRFPDFVDPAKAARLRSTIVFRLTGQEEPDRYVVTFADGACDVVEGDSKTRDATIIMDGADFLLLATGNLNPMKAGIQGKIGIKGDRGAAIALSRAMDVPRSGR
ncbi:SCP2 sterol-binding domain-containing protein [Luteipulveratus mongoliensis]|uniref:SCP2 domain-containing protein n=1 Tax=Luteipulveratus mongoliensis TaxID=571913 RepID=A0A0K1JJQ3_9MICO|nr:SCP2 sterol-binding domain-containing protein [Luteipulveratus mongoliensis]AKU16947.1 hypothetical protein VV02_15580 [Luteipulveratus mongoliensis]